jgi:hypothetical protein
MMVLACNRPRNLRSTVLDPTAMGRQHRNPSPGAAPDGHRVVFPFALRGGKICITAVVVCIRQGGQVHQQFQKNTPDRFTVTTTTHPFSATLGE